MEEAELTMEKAHAIIVEAKQKETELENAKMAAKNERTQAVHTKMCYLFCVAIIFDCPQGEPTGPQEKDRRSKRRKQEEEREIKRGRKEEMIDYFCIGVKANSLSY